MNGIANVIGSAMPNLDMEETEGLVISERQPGEDCVAFSAKKLTEIAGFLKTKSKDLTLESVRESILSSCEEFNHAHFYMLVQFGILVYYPSIAMSIIYQQYEQETDVLDDMMQQQQEQQLQPQPQSPQEQFVQQQQPQIISQLIELIQSMIQMQKQQQQQQQEQERQGRAMMRAVPMKKKNDDDDKRFIVRSEGGQDGGKNGLVWTTVFIQI